MQVKEYRKNQLNLLGIKIIVIGVGKLNMMGKKKQNGQQLRSKSIGKWSHRICSKDKIQRVVE